MFNKKLKTLKSKKTKRNRSNTNAFVNAAVKDQSVTVSGNGAKKYSTTDNVFVDQFGSIGMYKPKWNKQLQDIEGRTFNEIARDCEILWAEDKEMAVRFIIYIRMITRKTQLFNGVTTNEVQKGGEMIYEGIMRMIWLHIKDQKTFWKNIPLFISAGSWEDVFTMLRFDLEHHGWEGRKLNWKKFGDLIQSGLENDNTSNLVKKYLPTIRSSSNQKTLKQEANAIIGKWISNLVFGKDSYKRYRKLKSSGNAHTWQQLISQKKFNRIDFDNIHGRALKLLSRSKFFSNNGLEAKYEKWITNEDNVNVKFTGFVCELFSDLPSDRYGLSKSVSTTINKQFKSLVDKAGDKKQSRLIVVRDTSGSMSNTAHGTNMASGDIAKSLALYFSEFLTGEFEDAWIEFNNTAKMHKWIGNTPLDKWYNDNSNYYGTTNFQDVINLFIRLKNSGVPESEFPEGILCISDGEFNPSQLGKTNVETARRKLRRAGFSNDYVDNFIIILWNIPNNFYSSRGGFKSETYGDVKNVFYFSGYNGAVISFLTDEVKTAGQLFLEAMNQELLNKVRI